MTYTDEIIERERQFLLPTYNRYPIALERGKGVYVFDREGNRYLDFVAGLGVNALGHAHPRVVKAIREQSARAIHFSNLYYHEFQGRLAEKLCQLSGLNRAFFSNSGTEAIEGSIKLARLAGHRAGGEAKSRLVALEGSYHGRTFGAMSLTGQDKYRKGFEPLLEDVKFVPRNDVDALRAAVDDSTCAIVLEPIFGEGGIYECSTAFLQECRVLADQHQAALIFDEIQCGLGRTGTIFAFQSFGVKPDIVAIAKPIAAGLPLGSISGKGRIRLSDFPRPARHHLWRRPFGLPRGAGIFLHHRRRRPAGKCFPRRRVLAGTAEVAGRTICGRSGGSWTRLDSGSATGHSSASHRRAGAGRRRSVQQHAGYRAAFSPSVPVTGKTRGQGHSRPQEATREKTEVTPSCLSSP